MELQYSEKIENLRKYAEFKFEEVGDSITLYYTENEEAESVQYGKFNTLCGVSFNPEASSVEEAVSSLELRNFVINTVIKNLIDNGRVKVGRVYKFSLTSKKDQKYIDKHGAEKKTRSKHYEVVEVIGIPQELMQAIKDFANTSGISVEKPVVEENVVTLASLQNTPTKPRI